MPRGRPGHMQMPSRPGRPSSVAAAAGSGDRSPCFLGPVAVGGSGRQRSSGACWGTRPAIGPDPHVSTTSTRRATRRDLVIRDGERPVDDRFAGRVFNDVYDRCLDRENPEPPPERNAACGGAILKWWPDNTEDVKGIPRGREAVNRLGQGASPPRMTGGSKRVRVGVKGRLPACDGKPSPGTLSRSPSGRCGADGSGLGRHRRTRTDDRCSVRSGPADRRSRVPLLCLRGRCMVHVPRSSPHIPDLS
jgi:hypothetical protein